MSDYIKNASETTIRVLNFDGTDNDVFSEWWSKKQAIARRRGYRHVLLEDQPTMPTDTEMEDGKQADGTTLTKEQKELYKANAVAYSDMILDLSKTALHYAVTAKTDNVKEGDARLKKTMW